MNNKKPFRSDWQPTILHEFDITATGKTYRVTAGTLVSVNRRPNIIAGKYRVLYADRSNDGTLLIQVEGPITREPRRRVIRESDIKTVHIKSRPKGE